MTRSATFFAILIASAMLVGPAIADPCRAIPDRGPMPSFLRPGATFSGPVAYIGDGDSLCVDVGPIPGDPSDWVEVRLADFYAPELHEPGGGQAKLMLDLIAMGRRATCVAEHRSYDRVVARCTVAGRDLGDRLRAAGVTEGGRGR